jgi:2-phospho-L-lactate transferase/gluconeogenesis factor (CofD/UPF0052 family)
MKVVLFCGGRGNGSLIKTLVKQANIELTLVVNAYDDGLSTGEIRKLVPGFLGPSDFRKNLSQLLLPYSEGHVYFSKILEHRIQIIPSVSAKNSNLSHITEITADLFRNQLYEKDPTLKQLIEIISRLQRMALTSFVDIFFDYLICENLIDRQSDLTSYNDYAFGNILLAGAYIRENYNFSGAVKLLCSIFEINAKILNVSDDNRFLSALTNTGMYVDNEAKLVAGEFTGSLSSLILSERPLTTKEKDYLEECRTLKAKEEYLAKFESLPKVNSELVAELEEADIVLYGSGTQHSSLFPTYKVLAGSKITPSLKSTKILISNLDYDLDIQGWTGDALLESFMKYWGHEKLDSLVDFVITDPTSPFTFNVSETHAKILESNLRNVANPNIHDGEAVLECILGTDTLYSNLECEVLIVTDKKLEFADRLLTGYSNVLPASSVTFEKRVLVNKNPSAAAISHYNYWLDKKNSSRFLIIYTCEGEIEFHDLIAAVNLMKNRKYGAISGSRTQSRKQWMNSLSNTLGEGSPRFYLAEMATFLAIIAGMLRRFQILTDPLSRCLIIDKYALDQTQIELKYAGKSIPGLRTFLVAANIEVVEFPIQYKVYSGYRTYLSPFKAAIRSLREIIWLPR